jgi:hypothetical protein
LNRRCAAAFQRSEFDRRFSGRATAMTEKLDTVVRFLNRAEELRGIADGIKDPEIREAVLKWAEDCEEAARRAMESDAVDPPERSKKDTR